MKRLAIIALTGALGLMLTACGEQSPKTTTEKVDVKVNPDQKAPDTTSTTTTTTAPKQE